MKQFKDNSISSDEQNESGRCLKCVRSANRPDVHIDASGLCRLCREYEAYLDKHEAERVEWEEFVYTLREKYSKSPSRYHCMALFSGGKDSTYMLHLLSQIPNFRVVAVTIDHWFNSPETEKNIRQVLKRLPVDHINFRPAWYIAEELYKKLVVNTGELCLACEGFLTTEIYRLAVEMQIPCMAWGLSVQQFRTPPNWLVETDLKYWNKMHKRFILSLGHALGLKSELYRKFEERYVPDFADRERMLPDLLFPYIALGYDPSEVEQAVTKIGWKRPNDVSGISSNCYANHLHMYFKQKIYSTESLEDYLSNRVRKGAVSRERAMAVLQSGLDEARANEILTEIGLDVEVDSLAKGLFQLRRCMC